MGTHARRARRACVLVLAMVAGARAAQAPDPKIPATTDIDSLRRDIQDAKTRLLEEQRRIDDLEARLSAISPVAAPASTPVPAAAPAADGALEAQFPAALAVSPPAAPVPAAASPAAASGSGGAQLRLVDISANGLFAAGTSTANDDELALLDAGGHDPHERGFTVQNVELSLAGAVDPYLTGEVHVVFQLDQEGRTGVELEEAFMTTQSLPKGLQLKAGQFFTEFGRLNRQHPHTWHFANQPVVNSRLLGGEGLRGPGARLSWLTPAPWYSELLLTVQKSRGETTQSFFGTIDQDPIGGHPVKGGRIVSADDLLVSARWLNSLTLSDQTTLNLGASAAFGPNGSGSDTRTRILGLDVYLKWKREHDERGFPFVAWQTEIMKRRYEAGAFDDPVAGPMPAETLDDWGLYSQVTWGFKPGWTVGWRVDHAEGGDSLALDSRIDPARDRRDRLSSALTWFPTEFSKLRLQYDLDSAQFLGDVPGETGTAHSFWIQWEFTMGAHGAHEF